MVDLSKKIEDLSGDELRELKDESDRVVAAIRALSEKFRTLGANRGSQRQFPKDFQRARRCDLSMERIHDASYGHGEGE